MGLRAVVRQGRIVLDEPTSLPEGTILDLVIDDEGDELDAGERARLHASMSAAWAEHEAGLGRSAQDVLESLHARRSK